MEKVLILHGLDHDKMGKDAASPHSTTIETLNSQLSAEADAIENAVKAVLAQGLRTPDLFTGEGELYKLRGRPYL